MSGVPQWFDVDDDRTARAAWSRLTEPGDRTAHRLLARMGPGPALRALFEAPVQLAPAIPARSGEPSAAAAGWQVRLPGLDPRRDLATAARFGGRLLVPGDREWPGWLDQLGERAPIALWVRGPLDLAATCGRSVAVVGARACTGYGEHVAGGLAAGCADRRVSVVSGAAYGIDACAHRGALAVQGPTVAVLAGGIDRPYPRGNEALIERIATDGALLSEIPPGSAPTRWRFVQRNRLIAALSPATVVVEAAWRSGALITAREAVDLGRPVAAVPGPVTSAASAGCHRLLREGAVCVTDAAELVELIDPFGELAAQPAAPSRDHDGLDPVDLRVLDAVPLRRPATTDAVARCSGIDLGTVRSVLGRLELRGLAHPDAGRWRRSPPAGPRGKGGGSD